MREKKYLVRTERLKVYFPVRSGFSLHKKQVHAVDDITLQIEDGEAFGLVGESGCGKSSLANALLGLSKPTSGKVFFADKDLYAMKHSDLRAVRKDMQIIFQDPFSSLNPRFSVYQIISEPMLIRGGYTKEQMQNRVKELLRMVGLNEKDMDRYPGDFSGGQRQRIGIARAICLNPRFLVCDEPVSALDVSVHAQILNLLMELQQSLGMTYLFISHNLAVVRDVCRHMAVMYLGTVMEMGDVETIFNEPLHPYTQSLLSAVLSVDINETRSRVILKGELPSPIDIPKGCRFAGRCPQCCEKCFSEAPVPREVKGRIVACHLV